ncbi:histidine phosphatase family protein [Nocardioides cavernae]|uniref:histidine phosphatase family protein n=1 Tax=Nocardioides TaxID=1839 RepID=UPI001F3D8C23|nr:MULTISPECIES: histidine phosphatase family protein [Nocardioides]MCK9824737.1 histidine phosphatase family protein [Nocardioides cavernae]
MRSLVVVRHSMTRKGRPATDSGSHLSSEGVRSARALGDELPAFAHVAVGDQPRHLETAVALGCAVDERIAWPSGYVDRVVAHHDQWAWAEPFRTYAELLASSSALAEMAEAHLAHWHRMLSGVGDDAAVLVVSSGGSIEPVLVAAMPDDDHASWGSAFHHLEGARLSWDGHRFRSRQMIRRGRAPAPA